MAVLVSCFAITGNAAACPAKPSPATSCCKATMPPGCACCLPVETGEPASPDPGFGLELPSACSCSAAPAPPAGEKPAPNRAETKVEGPPVSYFWCGLPRDFPPGPLRPRHDRSPCGPPASALLTSVRLLI
jgi:hypothetical protein